MPLEVVGQRCLSEREPELGLGVVVAGGRTRIEGGVPATGEKRLYGLGTPGLKRVQVCVGAAGATPQGGAETAEAGGGGPLCIESVAEEAGIMVYSGQGRQVREDALSDVTSVSLPPERLLAGQVDPGEVFDLRYRALEARARFRQSEVR